MPKGTITRLIADSHFGFIKIEQEEDSIGNQDPANTSEGEATSRQ